MQTYLFENGNRLDGDLRAHPRVVDKVKEAPFSPALASHRTIESCICLILPRAVTYIFFISRLCMCMQPMMSGKRATMSLLLMVMLATIFFKAIFFVE